MKEFKLYPLQKPIPTTKNSNPPVYRAIQWRQIMMLPFFYWLLCLPAFGQTTSAQELANYQAIASQCASTDKRIGIRLFVAQKGNQLAQPASWFTAQLKRSNRAFQQFHLCFVVHKVEILPPTIWRIASRQERTKLGKDHLQRGFIHVFLVGQLDDVDKPGEQIRGVHWRHPKNRETKRWIILSKIAPQIVLAHELGHFFGLPHSKDPTSIMNKRARSIPMSKRIFPDNERKKIRIHWQRMQKNRYLKVIPLVKK